MTEELPDRYRVVLDVRADLVECRDCTAASGAKQVIPRTAVEAHELWHAGPNVRTDTHPPAAWPELGGKRVVHAAVDGGDGINVPLSPAQLEELGDGKVVTVRVTEVYDTAGERLDDRPTTVYVRAVGR